MDNKFFDTLISCPVCESTRTARIYSCGYLENPIKDFLISFYSSEGGVEFAYLEGADYILEECLDCQAVFQKEIPNDLLMKKLYEEWIDPAKALELHSKSRDPARYYFYVREILLALALLGKKPSELKFLDFGMGWGVWCSVAKSLGCDTYGVELSPSRQDHGRRAGVKVVDYTEIERYEFDFINLEQVLEHIPSPLQTVRQLKSSLSQRGLLKIDVPDGKDIKRRLSLGDWNAPKGSAHSLNSVSPLEHINCFTRVSLARMAHMADLEAVRIPARLQWMYQYNWSNSKNIVKNILRPFYSRLFPRGTHYLLRRKKGAADKGSQAPAPKGPGK